MWVWPFDEDTSAGFAPAFLLAPQLMGSVPCTPAGIKIILCYGSLERGAVADVLGVQRPLGLTLQPGSCEG